MSTTLFYFVCELFNTYIFCMQKIYKLSMSHFHVIFLKKHHEIIAFPFGTRSPLLFAIKKDAPLTSSISTIPILFSNNRNIFPLKDISSKNKIAGTQRFQLHLFSYMAVLQEKSFFHGNHFNFSEISLPTSIRRLIFVS